MKPDLNQPRGTDTFKQRYGRAIVTTFVFSLGYFLSYFSRTINAALTPHFQAEMELGADDLGLLASAYYLTFGLLQLPLGAAMDRYGPRIVNASIFFVAVLGGLVFFASETLTGLVIGRALIGAGVAGGLMCGFKIIRMWFPINMVPGINGVYLLIGSSGAALAGAPSAYLVDALGSWRLVFVVFAVAAAFISFLMLAVGRENNHAEHLSSASFGKQLRETRIIYSNYAFWSLVPIATIAQAVSLSVITLWSHRYLENVSGLSSADAAAHISYIAVGGMLGYLALGNLASLLRARYHVEEGLFSFFCLLAFLAVQVWVTVFPYTNTVIVWTIYGMLGTGGILCYPALCRKFPEHLAGRVNVSINFLVFMLAFACQWSMGVIIEQARPFVGDVDAHRLSFAVMIVIQVVCVLWFVYSRRRLSRKLN